MSRFMLVPAALMLAVAAVGCSGSSSGHTAPRAARPVTTSPVTLPNNPGALQAEANAAAAGDIPDNQIFLAFRNDRAGYSIKYPEGWAQQGSGGTVVFRDKNNLVRIVVAPGEVPTAASVRRDLAHLSGAKAQAAPRMLNLPGGRAFKTGYGTVSAPNAVTGKRVTLVVDRYYLWRARRTAVIDLGTPQGVDNVDAYRLMIESSVEVESLYREPERHEELVFGALEFHDVFKIFSSGSAETVALRGLELRIEQRELVALYGPSGSGKSTALHLAAGLDAASAGEVRVFGRSLSRLDEAELAEYRGRQTAIVFQSGNLWSELSVRENVVLALRLAGRRRDIGVAVDRALDAFDLRKRKSQRAGSLSGGEQQRVAIAAAAAREAPLVLADEPTGELDARNEQRVLRALVRLRDEFASTVVVVTHSPRLADAADRVIELRDGAAE